MHGRAGETPGILQVGNVAILTKQPVALTHPQPGVAMTSKNYKNSKVNGVLNTHPPAGTIRRFIETIPITILMCVPVIHEWIGISHATR